MEEFDVIIVGAGPAGLRCAEALEHSGLSILLLEKNEEPGHKICAGGITRKGTEVFNIPDTVVEHKVKNFVLHSRHYEQSKTWPEAIIYTVDRLEFGKWQLQRLNDSKITYRNNAKVTDIIHNKVVINSTEEIGFRFLVGADGPVSVVRKYLNIPVDKILTTIQYLIPLNAVKPLLEIYLDSRFFHSWYGWNFPHRHHIAVGTCANAQQVNGNKIKERFAGWLDKNGFDISNAIYQSYPINYDFRGLQFNNIFLAGEAAGMASGLTGEGIYQSLISGELVAAMIISENDYEHKMRNILEYNQNQERLLNALIKAGKLRNLIFDLFILLMGNRFINQYVTRGFL